MYSQNLKKDIQHANYSVSMKSSSFLKAENNQDKGDGMQCQVLFLFTQSFHSILFSDPFVLPYSNIFLHVNL